jgi:hypothetical protein
VSAWGAIECGDVIGSIFGKDSYHGAQAVIRAWVTHGTLIRLPNTWGAIEEIEMQRFGLGMMAYDCKYS